MISIFTRFLLVALTALALAMPATEAHAFGDNDRLRTIDVWTGNGTTGTTLSYLALPPIAGARYRVHYGNVVSDLSTADLILGTVANPITVTATSASGQAVVNAPGATFANADVVLAYSVANGTLERCVVSSSASGTVTMGSNLTYALAAGDRLYEVADGPAIRVGAAVKELNASGAHFFLGQVGKPLYIRLPGTSACKISTLSGDVIAP